MTAWVRFRSDPQRLALGLWLALGVVLTVRMLLEPKRHSVFPIFAKAAAHWRQDKTLYNPYPPLDMFRYPPVFAVAATPLAACGLRLGGVLWTWLNLAVLLAGLCAFARDVAPGRWAPVRRAAFLALSALGAARGLWNGQSNALAVGLLLLAASAVVRATATREPDNASRARRRWWRAALLLAAAVCLKLTPLAPALLLCALWPGRLGWRVAMGVAGGLLVPFLMRPTAIVLDQYTDWLIHLMTSGQDRWQGFRDGWTVWLTLRHLADGLPGRLAICRPIDAPAYRFVQLGTALAALAWCLWLRHDSARKGRSDAWVVHVTLCIGIAWLMLFGPAVEHATYVFLAPALAWAVVHRDDWQRGRYLVIASAALVLVLGWGALARAVIRLTPGAGSLILAVLPLGTALFAAWLWGYSLLRAPRAAASAGTGPGLDTNTVASLSRARPATRASPGLRGKAA